MKKQPIRDILGIKAEDSKAAAFLLRTINHDLRQRILQLLYDRELTCVTDIYIAMRLEQSVVSQHLSIMRRAGIVECERAGKRINYRINRQRFQALSDFIAELKTLKF